MAAAYAAEHNRPQPMSFDDQQRMMQATYVARMQRRSMPPRCNPFAILLLVLSVGMMFIGLTMTIIAHWPGATSIGENPLRIAGPVLFSVGGALVIFSIILVYCLNVRERRTWDEHLRSMVSNKMNSDKDNERLSDGTKSGGQSAFAGTGPASYYDGGYDPRRSVPGERGVDIRADPTAAGKGDSDPDSSVPVPVRVTKKRRSTQPRSDLSASDVSVGSGDLGGPGMTSTLRQDPFGPPSYANLSFEADTPERPRRPRHSGSREKDGMPRKRTADPIRDPVMRNVAAQQQQLRVHIKAQPGTAVHINPTATPPTRPGQDPGPAYHARPPAASRPFSGTESETEI